MITAAQWVPRGFAAPFPKKYKFDEAEFERIADLAKLQLDDAQEDLKEAQEGNGSDEDDDKTESKAAAKGDQSMEVDGADKPEKVEYV